MRVMTLNIWNYNRPWDLRRQVLVDVISTHDPDVVALQETRHDWRYERGRGQGEQLAERTGYHPTSAIAQVYMPLLRVDEGLTILTRQPPLDVEVRRLTQHRRERHDENRRICLAVRMEIDGKQAHIFDTHFSLSQPARETNAVECARFVDERAASAPAVLMGDLNAEPDAPEMRFLRGELELHGERASFLDCWTAIHPRESGFTYASYDPVKRIDYILARNLTAPPTEVAVVGEESRNGIFGSDHLGIVADLPL